MTEETLDIEIIQGAECARSTGTMINEKGPTLSGCATGPTAVDNHEAPSEVDVDSGGCERDPVVSSLINPVGSTSDKETMIWVKLRGGTFAFVIKAKEAGGWLKCADSFVEEEGLTEQSAMRFVVEALEDSEREEETFKLATMLLLWAACRCPAGKMAEEAARKGGKSVGFEITHNSDGSFYYGLHVRDGFAPNVRSLFGVRAAGWA